MHRKVAAALVAALALGIAGCGSSGPDTLSRADLVRQVEAACRAGQAESQKASRATRERGTSGLADAVLAGQKVLVDRLEGMTTSGAAKADYEAFRQAVQRRVDAIQTVASADRADVQRALRSVQARAEAATRRMEEAARSLGIKGCG